MKAEIVDPGDSQRASNEQEYSAQDLLYLRAMSLILGGLSIDEVADNLGYSDRQIRRWRQTERWRELWTQVAGDQVAAIRAQLIGLGARSVRTLRTLIDDASDKGSPTRAYVAFGILDRIRHVAPAEEDGQIRRIISRIPRSQQLQPMPMDMESGEAPELPTQSPTPIDAPEHYGIPQGDISQHRQSVLQRRIAERKSGMYAHADTAPAAGNGRPAPGSAPLPSLD